MLENVLNISMLVQSCITVYVSTVPYYVFSGCIDLGLLWFVSFETKFVFTNSPSKFQIHEKDDCHVFHFSPLLLIMFPA